MTFQFNASTLANLDKEGSPLVGPANMRPDNRVGYAGTFVPVVSRKNPRTGQYEEVNSDYVWDDVLGMFVSMTDPRRTRHQ